MGRKVGGRDMVQVAGQPQQLERHDGQFDRFGVAFDDAVHLSVQCRADGDVHAVAQLAVGEVEGGGTGSADQLSSAGPLVEPQFAEVGCVRRIYAGLAIGNQQQMDISAVCDLFHQCAARPEALVVGVGEYSNHHSFHICILANMNLTDDGILLIDKPADWTSFDVVAKLRGKRRAAFKAQGVTPTKRQLRVGHAGTLDPFATGLLIILLGEATKRSDEFLKQDKTYEATVVLGATSTTGDPEGELSPVSDHLPTETEIAAVLNRLTGAITQTPPAYSAIKIGGQRAYKLARKGHDVEIPTRQVTIHSLELLSYDYPYIAIRTHVSSGTYIRSLAQDIGEALGTGAYCGSLRRTRIGDMDIAQATGVDEIVSLD